MNSFGFGIQAPLSWRMVFSGLLLRGQHLFALFSIWVSTMAKLRLAVNISRRSPPFRAQGRGTAWVFVCVFGG